MSDASAAHSPVPLRRDLHTIPVRDRRRAYRIVVDEISGQFTRVSEHLWQALVRGDDDPQLWNEARAAGWTRDRTGAPRRRFSPLYFRIPIGSIDRIASLVAPPGGLLFSATAILCWSCVIVLATVLAASRADEIAASLGSLQLFFEQSNPLIIGAWFVATKIAHELGHAVMCRRMGSRCGSVGVLMLCGMPCPYCDVTDIWRQPSAMRRAAVMMAGIYIELIIAAVATLVWISATDPVIRLHALNLMVVCGISTIVFNANPLMRYDGYYVLADLAGSANLRQEAREAFNSVVTSRIAGTNFDAPRRRDFRSLAFACYHAASTLYRLVISIAIATLFLGVAEYLQVHTVMVMIIALVIAAMVIRNVRRILGVVRGAGRWHRVALWRRGFVCGLVVFLIAIVLLVPLPRYRRANGVVDAASATTVFLGSDGMIESVSHEFGDDVEDGQSLVELRSPSLAIQKARLEGQLRVARLHNSLARRASLHGSESAQQWRSLQATEDAIAAQLVSATQRVSQTDIRSPVTGVVLPAEPTLPGDTPSTLSLRDRVGTLGHAHSAWCRISANGALHAMLVIDARDRVNIQVGTAVKINLRESPEHVVTSRVTSVSAIHQDKPSVTRQAAYEVLCPLPPVDREVLLQWLGKECRGVFHLPRRTLAEDMRGWMREWLGG